MAAVTTELKVVVKAVGKGELKELEASLNKLAVTAKTKVDTNFKLVSSRLKEIQSTSTQSIKNLRDYRNAWRDIAAQLDISSKEFKEATAEAAKLDAQLAKAEKRRPAGRGGRLKAGAQIAGTIAGAGVFGGPEGAIGALGGGLIGGVGGAVVGGAIGAQLSQIRKLGSETATYKAEVEKLNIALRNVAGLEYADALLAITSASEDFNVPFKDATRTFTQLVAAGTANGNTVRELEVLYRGLSAATKATGGSTEDLNGVLLAATQVLSKGKVSAEELRGQIGERLPGAFSLFAQATGRTTQQLDEDLKAGAVSAEEFVTDFAKFIDTKYKDAAAEIANSPSEAGARLERTLKNLQVAIGPILQGIGAEFQIFANEALTGLTPLLQEMNKFFKLDRSGKNTRLANLEKNKIPEVEQIIRDMAGRDGDSFVGIPKSVAGMFDNPGSLKSVNYVFKQASKKLVEFQGRARQLRLELFPVAREQADLPTSRTTIEDKGKGSAKAAANRVGGAILGIEKLMSKLKSMNVSLTLSAKKVGATAEEEIKIKYEQSLQKAIDVTEGLNNQLIKYEDTIGRTVPEVREELNKLRMAYVDLADAERAAALQELADKRFGEKLKGYGFTGEALDAGGKIFAAGALDEQAFPAGVDSILNPNKLKESIQEIKKELEELTNPVNQIVNAATTIGTAFSDSFKSVIDGSATTQEALAGFFKNISNYFLDMAMQIIQKMITMYVLNQAIGLLPGLGSTGSGFNLSGFGSLSGDSVSGASGFFNAASINPFAKGGIMGQSGPMDLKRYARGGIASSPQLAMFGEGSTPEAYVPLPDGRSIPVTMRGNGAGSIVVNVDAKGTQVEGDEGQSKQLGTAISAAVQAELIKQQRPGGLLSR